MTELALPINAAATVVQNSKSIRAHCRWSSAIFEKPTERIEISFSRVQLYVRSLEGAPNGYRTPAAFWAKPRSCFKLKRMNRALP